MFDSPTLLDVSVTSETASLSALRLSIESTVRDAGGDQAVVDDLCLVASELATNVMLHTDQEQIAVSVRRRDSDWELEMSGARGLAESGGLHETTAPPNDRVDGRGLMIVRAVVGELSLFERQGDCWLRAVARRRA